MEKRKNSAVKYNPFDWHYDVVLAKNGGVQPDDISVWNAVPIQYVTQDSTCAQTDSQPA